jgi:transposase
MDPSKQQLLAGKYIIGIDPAKAKHQAVILNPDGLQVGKSFAFDVSHEGYHVTLWHKIALQLPLCKTENTVFAIETSCNLWMTLAFYLKGEGYTVVMVSPLTTHLSRPMAHHVPDKSSAKRRCLLRTASTQP